MSSKFRRALRWEFWPMSVFYIPIVLYIVTLALRYRGLSFLAVNPGLTMSGLVGERKAESLVQLAGSEFLARFIRLDAGDSDEVQMHQAQRFMLDHKLSFPVVLKPDFGQRGQGVAVIRDQTAMHSYLVGATGDILLQEYVDGEEFGVFYMRYPDRPTAEIFSITEKTFPEVIGNGESSLEVLLMENSRTHYMAEYLLELHSDQLDQILGNGEIFKAVEIGSHCRGSVFLDGNHLISPELVDVMQSLSEQIDGFFFGRYDIRAKDKKSLRQGRNFKVIEVNGVTSESTNAYDPDNSVLTAYKILFTQWRAAFEIGKQNINSGATPVSLFSLLDYLKKIYRKSSTGKDLAS